MDLTKVYYDQDENPCNILQLVKKEPEWAANRIQDGERAIEALREYQRFNRIHNDVESYLWKMAEWAFGKVEEKPNPEHYGLSS